MPTRIKCPGCDSVFAVADEQRGKKVRCRSCDKTIAVPSPPGSKPREEAVAERRVSAPSKTSGRRFRDDDLDDERPAKRNGRSARDEDDDDDDRPRNQRRGDDDEDDYDDDRSRHRRRRDEDDEEKSKAPLIIGLCAGGVGLLTVLIVVVFLLMPGGGDAQPQQQQPIAQANPQPNLIANAPAVQPDVGVPAMPQPQPQPMQPVVQPVALPQGPVPAEIDGTARDKVKRSTAYLRVQMGNGEKAEGSGFFALEPGLVMTNAHVLGMLSKDSKAPTKVDVVVNSGQPDELTMVGALLGVDRTSDLAVLRVQGDNGKMPPPLPVDTATSLTELQKLYVFGFPFGSKLGSGPSPAITITPASVSSLRKDGSGSLTEVQLHGGMQPGNSGGPVADTRGVVVGVAVAIIKGTQINFAIPGDNIKLLVDGKVTDHSVGEAYIENAQTKVPVKVACLDPLNRIRGVKLDVWTGPAGTARPMSMAPPASQPGDGARQQLPVTYANGTGTADVTLPPVEPGKVLWVQPVVTTASGAMQWAAATVYQPSATPPVERKATVLQLKTPTAKTERTLKLKSGVELLVYEGKQPFKLTDNVEADVLESVQGSPQGGMAATLYFGKSSGHGEEGGRMIPRHPLAMSSLPRLTAIINYDPAGKFAGMTLTSIKLRDFTADEDLNDLYNRICNGYQATVLTVPGGSVNPQQTWTAKPRMLVGSRSRKRKDSIDLELTCTYEGVRMNAGRNEAVISLVGDVKTSGLQRAGTGKATGKAVFDVDAGYFSSAAIDVKFEKETEGVQVVCSLKMDLTRSLGNPLNIQPPASNPSPAPGPGIGPGPQPGLDNIVKGPVLLNIAGMLTKKDQADPQRPGSKCKIQPAPLSAGKTYMIEMNKLPGSPVDPFLRLEDSKGATVAQDDDSGGMLNARIIYTPTQNGFYRIVCTTFNGQMGTFQLTVTEVRIGNGPAPGINQGVPNINPAFPGMNPGMPFNPGAQPGAPGFNPGAQPGAPGFNPGAQPGAPGFNPGGQPGAPGFNPGAQPGAPGFNPGANPGVPGMNPPAPGANPAAPGANPAAPGGNVPPG